MRRTGSVAASVLVLTTIGVVALVFGGVSTSVDREPDIRTASRAYRGGVVARSSCAGDACSVQLPGPLAIRIPASMGRVDFDVSLTVEYETTRGDPARILMRLRPPGEAAKAMRPVEFVLRPSRTTSTTLHWIRNNVPVVAGDFEVTWQLLTAPGASAPYDVKATEAVLVVRATAG